MSTATGEAHAPGARREGGSSGDTRDAAQTVATVPPGPDEHADIWTREALSTRLFPKNKGANKYRITGIAACCDWVLLSDRFAPQTHVFRRVSDPSPRSIFVSMRNPEAAIPALSALLEGVRARRSVIVIIGSEDRTFPI